MKKNCTFLFLAVLLSAAFLSSRAGFAGLDDFKNSFGKEVPKNYRLVDHLPAAEAALLEPGKVEVKGVWQQNRFIFPGQLDQQPIQITANTFNGIAEQGITVPSTPNAVTRLQFKNVTGGSMLFLEYGIDDAEVAASPEGETYIRVWVGKHELKRVRVPTEKGWKRERIDLGPLYFLKHPVAVTFEMTSDSVKSKPVTFRAEIKL